MFRILNILFLASLSYADKIKVLSFGGNGNIGSSTLSLLIKTDRFDISIVTRGAWHWDSKERIKPFVQQYTCNREYEPECAANKTATDCDINALRQCPELIKFISETEHFDLVLDFSAYHPKWVHDSVQVLKGKVGLYIYISTDSVYEVSKDKPIRRASKEADAIRPTDENEIELLKKKDPYGHYKLAGEEALAYYGRKDGVQWVALRLSDVIGPRDTTLRWWVYHMWVKFYDEISKPIPIPEIMADKVESMTYVEDVGQAVLKVYDLGSSAWNQAYNIALDEEFTLSSFLLRLRDGLGKEKVLSDVTTKQDIFHGFPSVMSGPVDISKAEEILGFVPTPVETVFKDAIAFYEGAFVKYETERDLVLRVLFDYAVEKDRKEAVYASIDRILTEAGLVDKRLRKKRKGDLAGLPTTEQKKEEL